ncbi:hypothetical protein GJ496_011592 [Pomphorhynchus laevis]|nr:hypothetical protein GJ496_011592 [Pomphorhynchus laevis]
MNISSESNAKSSRNFTTSPFFAQVLRPAVTRSVLATSQINKDASPLKILQEAERDSRRPANVIIRGLPVSQAEENEIRKMISLIDVEVGYVPLRARRFKALKNEYPQWLLRTKNEFISESILRNSKHPKNSDDYKQVFVHLDLSPVEQCASKALVAQLKDTRTKHPSEHYVIRNNRIVRLGKMSHLIDNPTYSEVGIVSVEKSSI